MPQGGLLDTLLSDIQKSSSVQDRSSAIRIAKSQGHVKQDGDSLALTEEGRNAAQRAKKSQSDKQAAKNKARA